MSDLIKKIQELQKLNYGEISLPTIVAIGPQSCGKSSVIEQILQLEILPRGKNLVTRCPVIINLIKSDDEYVEVEECRFKVTEIRKIKKKIELEMNKRVECANYNKVITTSKRINDVFHTKILKTENEFLKIDSNDEIENNKNYLRNYDKNKIKNISKDPITVNFSSKENINLTVIDLPGLIKIPVNEQPKNMKTMVEDMVLKYIENERTIILAVINAGVDISNSESLEYAFRVDPKGYRTIGILTKIDLMDKGTDCIKILNNEYIRLRYGYVGLVNRGELLTKRSLKEGVELEEAFFNHSIYNGIENKGSIFLRKYLSEILYKNIKSNLPSIKNELNKKIKELKENRSKLMEIDLFYVVNKFIEVVVELLEEKSKKYISNLNTVEDKQYKDEFYINKENIFYYNKSNENINELLYFDVEEVIEIEYFKDNTLFISDNIFLYNIQKNIERKNKEIEKRIEDIFKIIKYKIDGISTSLDHNILFSLLNHLEDILYQRMSIFKSNINLYCQIETVVNINHPDFNKNRILRDSIQSDIVDIEDKEKWNLFSFSKEKKVKINNLELTILNNCCNKYFIIVQKNIYNYFYKAYNYFVVKFIKNNLTNELLSRMDNFKVENKLKHKIDEEIEKVEEMISIINSN